MIWRSGQSFLITTSGYYDEKTQMYLIIGIVVIVAIAAVVAITYHPGSNESSSNDDSSSTFDSCPLYEGGSVIHLSNAGLGTTLIYQITGTYDHNSVHYTLVGSQYMTISSVSSTTITSSSTGGYNEVYNGTKGTYYSVAGDLVQNRSDFSVTSTNVQNVNTVYGIRSCYVVETTQSSVNGIYDLNSTISTFRGVDNGVVYYQTVHTIVTNRDTGMIIEDQLLIRTLSSGLIKAYF